MSTSDTPTPMATPSGVGSPYSPCRRLSKGYWHPRRLAWLAQAYRRHPLPDLVRVYNDHWAPLDGFRLDYMQIKGALTNYRITSGRDHHDIARGNLKHPRLWQPVHLDWLRQAPDYPALRFLLAAFNEHFGTSFTAQALRAVADREGIKLHYSRDKPVPWNKGKKLNRPMPKDAPYLFGNRPPARTVPLGSLRKNNKGYWMVKAYTGRSSRANGGLSIANWRQLHRHLWTEAHGPVPAGHVIAFKDGNPDHCVLDNLICITRQVMHHWTWLLPANPTPEQRQSCLQRAHLRAVAYCRSKELRLDPRQIRPLFPVPEDSRRRDLHNPREADPSRTEA